MSNQGSRFSYKPCGTMRILWLALSYPNSWRERSCDEVIDHERRVRFQFTPEEDDLLLLISELMHEMRIAAGVSMFRPGKFLTRPRLLAVRDRVFAAISNKRHGDDSEWRRLVGMAQGELVEWIEQVWWTNEGLPDWEMRDSEGARGDQAA